jgi:hypothetical protein
MKNLLAFLAAAVIMFGGVGWYLDWFQVFHGPAAAGHHVFSVDLDAAKMQADVRKGEEKVADVIEKARKDAAAKKAAGNSEPAVNSLPAPSKPIIGAGAHKE